MSDKGELCIRESEVESLISLPESIDAIRSALATGAGTGLMSLSKSLATWPGGSLHSLGASWPNQGFAGFKTWINTTNGAQSVFNLFDTTAGRLVAIIDARYLGRLRTAAVASLAIQSLATPGAKRVALLGTGRQAMMQAAAAHAAIPNCTFSVWSPTSEHRETFSHLIEDELGVIAVPVSSSKQAVMEAQVIVTVTRATEPFLRIEDLSRPVHVNAMGAILPGSAELEPAILENATLIVADDIESTTKSSREIQVLLEHDPRAMSRIRSLEQILSEPIVGNENGLSVFKSVGLGSCDLALAILVATRHGI
jgi:ornithine cyclodeaminase